MSEVRKMNIDKVMRNMNGKKNEGPKVLNQVRQVAYNLCAIQHKSDEEVIKGTFSFAKIAIQDGSVTKEEVEKEIAKVFTAVSIQNKNKTR